MFWQVKSQGTKDIQVIQQNWLLTLKNYARLLVSMDQVHLSSLVHVHFGWLSHGTSPESPESITIHMIQLMKHPAV